MRSALIALIFIAVAALANAGTADSIKWSGLSGTRVDATHGKSDTVILMRSGFFRAPVIRDFDHALKELLNEFPDAAVVSVAKSIGWSSDDPNEVVTYVWIVAKDKNLNVEMVRRGYFAGGTQLPPSASLSWTPLITPEQEHEFIERLGAAEEEARKQHRGIWKEAKKDSKASG